MRNETLVNPGPSDAPTHNERLPAPWITIVIPGSGTLNAHIALAGLTHMIRWCSFAEKTYSTHDLLLYLGTIRRYASPETVGLIAAFSSKPSRVIA